MIGLSLLVLAFESSKGLKERSEGKNILCCNISGCCFLKMSNVIASLIWNIHSVLYKER